MAGQSEPGDPISIHALLAESDSIREGTTGRRDINFYPRSPCGERHLRVVDGSKSSIISIHALLAESDGILVFCGPQGSGFLSTLSLRRATCVNNPVKVEVVFLSTLSLRRATGIPLYVIQLHPFLSTLSLRRATSVKSFMRNGFFLISIHALLAESDLFRGDHGHMSGDISIHALLAESDLHEALHGRRFLSFLSTLSLRRATGSPGHREAGPHDFYPRSPCGERHGSWSTWTASTHFYPRSPCGERRG